MVVPCPLRLPAPDSPELYEELSGKVICHFSFRDAVPPVRTRSERHMTPRQPNKPTHPIFRIRRVGLAHACLSEAHHAPHPHQGVLSRLVLQGMRPRGHTLEGLAFETRPWSRVVLAKDHVEIPQDGYTVSLTIDRRRARVSCALSCQEGLGLTPHMEAQVGGRWMGRPGTAAEGWSLVVGS